jgi:hypothetical protein
MNVRWDAVVKSNTFRTSRRASAASLVSASEATAANPEAACSGVPVEIQVWLFGMLAGSKVTNPLVLRFEGVRSLRDVLDELRAPTQAEFLRTVISESGEALNTCRVFLGGELAKSMAPAFGWGGGNRGNHPITGGRGWLAQ